MQAGARSRDATVGSGEQSRAFHDIGSGAGTALFSIGEAEGFDGGIEFVKAADIIGHVVFVVPFVLDDLADHAGQQAGIFTGLHLQMHVGFFGKVTLARVDHHQLHTAFQRLLDPRRRVGLGHGPLMGHHRVGADEQGTVCMVNIKDG